eukprot:scaffold3403_cov579-Prasinococcus_capsulatus_cf.AAC.1
MPGHEAPYVKCSHRLAPALRTCLAAGARAGSTDECGVRPHVLGAGVEVEKQHLNLQATGCAVHLCVWITGATHCCERTSSKREHFFGRATRLRRKD